MQAVKYLGKIGAPVELRDFADGVRVLQSLSHSNEQVRNPNIRLHMIVCAGAVVTIPQTVTQQRAGERLQLVVISHQLCLLQGGGPAGVAMCAGVNIFQRYLHSGTSNLNKHVAGVCSCVAQLVRGDGLGPAL